jgi:hypothetical protein
MMRESDVVCVAFIVVTFVVYDLLIQIGKRIVHL